MSTTPRRLLDRMFERAQGPAVAAAFPAVALACVFLVLLTDYLLGTKLRFPGREFFAAWWFLELGSLWSFPLLNLIQRWSGPRGVATTVVVVLPVLIATLVVPAVLFDITALLGITYLLLFVFHKAVSFYCTMSSTTGRESVLCRAMVTGFAWLFSVLLGGLLVLIAKIALPIAVLSDDGVIVGAMLASGAIYFSLHAALELMLPRFGVTTPVGARFSAS